MKETIRFIKNTEWLTLSIAVMLGVLFIVSVAQAATTISTDVTTGGNVYATSTIQATGAITGYSTLTVIGASTFANASTTLFSSYGPAYFGGSATSSFGTNGQLTLTSPTSVVLATNASGLVGSALGTGYTWTALQQFQGSASSTLFSSYGPAYFGATATSSFATNGALTLAGNLTIPANYSLDTATAGTLNIGTTTANAITIGKAGVTTNNPGLTTMTNASTTQLTVGGSTGTPLNTLQAGFCSIASTAVTASTTAYVNCTGAGTVDNTYRIFVQATSSMPAQLSIRAASSTVTAGTINVLLYNDGITGGTTAANPVSINFWAFK